MSLFPALYDSISTGQQQATNASQLAAEGLYLELVRVVTDSIPRRPKALYGNNSCSLMRCISQMLVMLLPYNSKAINTEHTLQLLLAFEVQLALAYISLSLVAGGTGKSFLLKALQAWCTKSHLKHLLLAPSPHP